jgi:hypothetical protein
MKHLRELVSACLSTALFSGCAAQSNPGLVTTPNAVYVGSASGLKTFNYTGQSQIFRVPTGVKRIKVVASGATGGGVTDPGGLVTASIPVVPGQKLVIFVGGRGKNPKGGFNGGGAGAMGSGSAGSYGGGGASDVRQDGSKLDDRVVVAAGSGGQGASGYGYDGGSGGAGGAIVGGRAGRGAGDYVGGSGYGGGQHSGGGGGGPGNRNGLGSGSSCEGAKGAKGAMGHGGAGGTSGCFLAGGGGGSGYYGGGGGGESGYVIICSPSCTSYFGSGGGGGGGANFVESKATGVSSVRGGASRGNGQIVLSW